MLRAALVAMLGLAGLLLVVETRRSAPAGYWAPEGYVAQADSLIAAGGLRLLCADQDSIIPAFPPGSPEEEFYNASYLRADVREFNSSPSTARSPFLIEGCQIFGVDPFYHRIDLPFNRLPRWRGSVFFTHRGTRATFVGGADQLLELRYPATVSEAASGTRTVSPDDRGAEVEATLLRLREPRSREVTASAFFVGDHPVLADSRDPGSDAVIRVNGFRTPAGRVVRLQSGDWLQLGGPGPHARHTYLTELGDRARTASFVRVRNDDVVRQYPAERLRPLMEEFSLAMDLALQSTPGASAGAAVTAADVRLTVDRTFHDRLEAVVLDWCEANRHPTRPRAVSILLMDGFTGDVLAVPSCPGQPELEPYEPLTRRTRDRFLRNQNLVPHPVGSAGKPFWAAALATSYPNFLDLEVPAHPAGPSPALLGCDLRAPYHDTHGSGAPVGLEEFLRRSCNRYVVEATTAALALGTGPGASACRNPVDPDTFVDCFPPDALAGAGQTAAEGPTDFRVCDRTFSLALDPALAAVGERCDQLQLVHDNLAAANPFEGLTKVRVYGEPPPRVGDSRGGPGLSDRYRVGRYRTDAWAPVLTLLNQAGDTTHAVHSRLRFSGVSPQNTNLALNSVEELRQDWVNLLLGGENSRWSNFALAEATARLLTGRDVIGTFVAAAGITGDPADWGTGGTGGRGGPGGAGSPSSAGSPGDAERRVVQPLGSSTLHPGARRRVVHAMELAIGPAGTAGRLSGRVQALGRRLERIEPEPYDLYVVAKTGTPAVEKYVSSTQQRLVQRLWSAGDLQWDAQAGRLRLAPDAERTVIRDAGTRALDWLRQDVIAPIESDPARYTVGPDGAIPLHPLYFDARGRLRVREIRDLAIQRQGGLLILGLLAVPRSRGRDAAAQMDDWVSACVAPDLRRDILEVPPADLIDPATAVSLTAAIYIDDLAVGEGSPRAVELAGRAWDEVEAELLRRVEEAARR